MNKIKKNLDVPGGTYTLILLLLFFMYRTEPVITTYLIKSGTVP